MAGKFLQTSYTGSRKYANHKSGKKYDEMGTTPEKLDSIKKAAARLEQETSHEKLKQKTMKQVAQKA